MKSESDLENNPLNNKQVWPVERALISVSDKSGLLDLANGLGELGIEIISTGGTARALAEAGIPVTEVSDYTGFPEMMDGRLKTLHPKVHGGLLGRLNIDREIMAANGITPIGLVIVNLYPFEQTVANPDCDLVQAIENIDIGGPAMLRGGAKNHAYCGVIVNPSDYPRVLDELKSNGNVLSAHTRFDLAVKAFEHTARYDGAIANYLGRRLDSESVDPFPRTLSLQFQKMESLRYGENPHQQAAWYREHGNAEGTVVGAVQKQGKALSFNNIADADAALECAKQFEEPACVIVKHANPCGVALGATIAEAYERAYACDSTSAFGGVIAFNRVLDADTAGRIVDRQFVELIIAPGVDDTALDRVSRKKDVRILDCGPFAARPVALDLRRINSGLLVQDSDAAVAGRAQLKQVTTRAPDDAEIEDMLFAWRVAKYVKSNTIVYVKGKRTLGIGAGQMSRVDSAKIAVSKAAEAGLSLKGAVMASDAFFPFRDGIDAAHGAGVKAVIQPGGSLKDQEVIDAANEHGIAMMFTGERHFRH